LKQPAYWKNRPLGQGPKLLFAYTHNSLNHVGENMAAQLERDGLMKLLLFATLKTIKDGLYFGWCLSTVCTNIAQLNEIFAT
jgi:hypothetical protein